MPLNGFDFSPHRTPSVVDVVASDPMDDDLESRIRVAHDEGDWDRAMTLVVRGYGSELMGFLCARMGSEDLGGEVFGVTCEKLWKGLPAFQWRSSARGWAYAVARNAMHDHWKSAHERPDRKDRLSQLGDHSHLVQKVRSETAIHRKTSTKTRMQQLREQLPGEDQTLLILRVDRGLAWKDLALVMADGPLDDPALSKESARLRQRFQTVKARLKKLAIEAGLL